MVKVFLDKLRNTVADQRGESLIEVLAAIVISGLAILMLATTVATAVSVNMSSEKVMNAYYDASNELAKQDTGASTDTLTMMQGLSIVTFSGDRQDITVNCYSENIGGAVVVSYEEKRS